MESVRLARMCAASVPAPATPPFHLAVDDAGEFLVALGDHLTIGHLRSDGAALRFLADIESEHARLERRESFHGGVEWTIAAIAGAHLLVNGAGFDAEARVLRHGDRIELARNLRFHFRLAELASSSALFDLEGAAECQGARRVVLLGQGPAGRLRIANKRGRAIVVADLEREVVLDLVDGELEVCCDAGVALVGTGPRERRDRVRCALPPAQPICIETWARGPDRPPFALTLRPVDPPPARRVEPHGSHA